MRPALVSACVASAFVTGLAASRLVLPAEAQLSPPPLAPQIISTADIKDEDISPIVPLSELRSRTLVVTEHGTVGLQVGNIFKHIHADANELQYIVEGQGSFWLGDSERQIKAGDLIVIPKGTVHAGSKPSTGRFKAIAIKMPPQRPDDTKRVD